MFRSVWLPRLLFVICSVLVGGTIVAQITASELSRRRTPEQVYEHLEGNLRNAKGVMDMLGASPDIYQGRLWIGNTDIANDTDLVDELKKNVNGNATIFDREKAVATTIPFGSVRRKVGFSLPDSPSLRNALFNELADYRTTEVVDGETYFVVYSPLVNKGGVAVGAVKLSSKEPDSLRFANRLLRWTALMSGLALSIVAALFFIYGRKVYGYLTDTDADLRKTNSHLDQALTNMANGICMFSADNRLMVASKHYVKVLGLREGDIQPGMTLLSLVTLLTQHVEGVRRQTYKDIHEKALAMLDATGGGETFDYVWNGRTLSITHTSMAGGGRVVTYEDVTEERNSANAIAFMATHDGLTGLPNRVALNTVLAQHQPDEGTALLMLDLDHFKEVNDTLGHPAGDALLKAVCDRLATILPPAATLARLGGDEFTAVCPSMASREAVADLARRMVQSIGRPFDIEGHTVNIGTSIGILMPPAGQAADTSMKQADLALYRAKAQGRGRYAFYEEGMDAHLLARKTLENDLRTAALADQFELHYQPLFSLASRKLTGFEALMRWRHSTRGMVSPRDFIPLAEETGLIVQMGAWAVRRACLDAARWDGLKVAVNVSPVQFSDPNLTAVITRALADSNLPPNLLEIEVTETAMAADRKSVAAILHDLKALGVRISMDDFGTGSSGLTYILDFPFDKVKVDRTFVAAINERRDAIAIVNAVVSIGRDLNMTTLGEGIETEEQLERLRDMGCQEGQGWLVGTAVSASKVPAVIERIGIHRAAANNNQTDAIRAA